MDPITMSLVLLAVVLVALGSGAWIFIGLFLAAFFSFSVLLGFPMARIGSITTPIVTQSVFSFELAAVPLFIWMGEIISGTNLSAKIFSGIAPWVSRVPGGLLHANVGGSVLFSALSGSSVATTATIGKVTTRELTSRGYNPSLVYGSIAVAGTIGIMIPPSITLIVYGLVAQVSVAKLFAAGVLPGVMLGALYSGYILLRCVMRPEFSPPQADHFTWGDRFRGLINLVPVTLLVLFLMGSIYGGFATPSESAAVGVLGATIIAAFSGGLTLKDLYRTAMNAIMTTAMIGSALAAAALLTTAVGYMHLPQLLAEGVAALNLSPVKLLILLTIIYILLGTVLDGIPLVLMTVPVILPLMAGAGFDPIWIGIYIVLMVEVAIVSPPIGFNLFVLRSITGVSIGKISMAALPFVAMMLLGLALLTAFPGIALWLPSMM
ncbi:C4-dicarboxylate ABC transporter permease [Nitratireductor aestuarii]|uniref:TRAP transporter large permease protein n=1 Tax=Nitratireductor aestuarii TaxID=1735103 RepID=A0A916S296_9HYPH|nr:TRAP transporter large permease subunit [Nitratireductor aestuarii]GGA81047.1 C4-dicarboxylate ABC transporter permease [Nitratireductor aestuarii]